MLKISESQPAKHAITFRLEGRVIGPWVDELQKVCDPLVGSGTKVVLDLTDVSFADPSGTKLLAGLKARGIKLLNATPFLKEQLKLV